jgi:hypothetical protein
LVSSFHSPGGKNTIFAGKYLPASKPNETRAFYIILMGGPDWARSQRPSIFCFFLSNLSQTVKTGEKIQIMERCNFREIWKEISGSEIHPQAFYSELFMNYVISPGREFADGCRIRGHDPNSPEFGIVSPSS